jgi:Leucine-rich repeat (LRR) protein
MMTIPYLQKVRSFLWQGSSLSLHLRVSGPETTRRCPLPLSVTVSAGGASSFNMAEPYDVFISHCGKDSKRDFAVWLKKELELAGVRCFLDERDLKLGNPAAETMLKAMAEAKYGVVILSKGFFEREWCVKELETFLGRKYVLPVFLGMAPGDLSGVLESVRGRRVWEGFEWFSWTEAEYLGIVEQAGAYTGLRLEAVDGFWDACIRRLKSELLFLLDKLDGGVKLSGSGPLFGIEEHLATIKQLLGVRNVPLGSEQDEGLSERVGEGGETSGGEESEIQAESSGLPEAGAGCNSSAREVGIVGVKGMGGVGKTTLAKRLYDDAAVRSFFSGRVCWVEVNEKPGPEKVCRLQEQVIRKMCQEEVRICSPTEGRDEIRKKLGRGGPVLICLDDMWDDGDPVVVETADLVPGSRILKTTRDAMTIGPSGIRHDLEVLDPPDAERLFLWHAFGGATPADRIAALVNPTVAFCGGLPLALEVLGSSVAAMLASNDGIGRWTDLVADLQSGQAGETRPGRNVHDVLKRSYDLLPDQRHKDAFVLIAGLWPDEPRFRRERMVVAFLGASVYGHLDVDSRQRRARIVLSELSYRSLLKKEASAEDTDTYGSFQLSIHDLLTDFARSVVDGTQSDLQERRFLRWVGKPEAEPPSDHTIEHVLVDPLTPANFPHSLFGTGAKVISFIAMIKHTFSLPELAPGLRHCRLLSIRAENYEYQWSPSGTEGLSELQVLDLVSGNLWNYPSSKDPALHGSPSLSKGLSHVHLVGQPWLQSLDFTDLDPEGLLELHVKTCSSLTGLKSGPLRKLQRLEIVNCRRASFPTNLLSGLCGLEHAEVTVARLLPEEPGNDYKYIEHNSSHHKMLHRLVLDGCNGLLLSVSLGPSLICLEISNCHEIFLPEGFAVNLSNLTSLKLLRWPKLRGLPPSITSLLNLSELDLSDCHALETLPTEISSLTNLSALQLGACYALRSLPDSIVSLKGLWALGLGDCVSLQHLPSSIGFFHSLHTLIIAGCRELKELPAGIGSLELKRFQVSGCSKLEKLPTTIGRLTSLKTLNLANCTNLKELPPSIGSMVTLECLDVSNCVLLEELPSSIGNLPSLTYISLESCFRFWTLPEYLSNLQNLEHLNLHDCAGLVELPPWVSRLTSLKKLDLSYCHRLKEWPSLLTSLTNLKLLFLRGISKPAFCHMRHTMPGLIPVASLREPIRLLAGFVLDNHRSTFRSTSWSDPFTRGCEGTFLS